MTAFDFIPLGIVGVLVAASFIHRGMMTAAQPHRLALADKGEAFLLREDIPTELRADVESVLEDAFPCNCMLMFLLLPLIPLLVWHGRSRSHARSSAFKTVSPEVRGRYLEIRQLHRKIVLANHPIMAPLVDLIGSLSVVLISAGLVLAHKASSNGLDADGAMLNLEQYRQSLPGLHARKVQHA